MLDTSDKAVFESGYDASLGTSNFGLTITDTKAIVLVWDKVRRNFILANAGITPIYISLTPKVTPDLYTLKLRANGIFAMDNYGGIVTASCGTGPSSKLYITDVH